MSWDGYTSHVLNSIFQRLKTNEQKNETNKKEDKKTIICLQFPKTLLTSSRCKIKRCLKDVKFITSYYTKKIPMFYLEKDNKVKTTQKANDVYDILCPACKEHYIGKTDRCFVTHLHKHES